MGHRTSCETAEGCTCTCSCGGALHGALLIRGIATSDPDARAKASEWAEPRRWTHLPAETQATTIDDRVTDRRPAVTGVVSELVISLIAQSRADSEIDVIATLAHQISDKIGEEFERHLANGGPDPRSTHHFWCVVLTTLCRLYDQGFDLVNANLDDRVEGVMRCLRKDTSANPGEESEPRGICHGKSKTIVLAFTLDESSFLEALIRKAIHAVTVAVKAIGEETVFRHLRLMATIVCPDPDRHPDVVKYCLWPLVSGPLAKKFGESVAAGMRTWLRNAYRVVPVAQGQDVT